MATATGQAARHLTDALLADAKNMAFFPLVERLHALHGDDLEQSRAPSDERVRLASYAGLGFPSSEVTLAERQEGDRDRYRIQVAFWGLHGPDSPLPGHYIEAMAHESAHGIGVRTAFLDFFHHRWLTLLHRSWRKYRYYVRFRPQASDAFSRYVFSLLGLNDTRLRGESALPWGRLLSYAGVIASRSRSPTVLAGVVAHSFELTTVRVHEFVQTHVNVPDYQRHALGLRNATLGADMVLGARVATCAHKFLLAIGGLDLDGFKRFLPGGMHFEPLRSLIAFLLRDPIPYDLALGLRHDAVPAFALKDDTPIALGWTTFLGAPPDGDAVVRIEARV